MKNKPNYLHIVYLSPSKNGEKKYSALYADPKIGKWRIVHFGQRGAKDFILHKGDKAKQDAYIARHKANEDWTINGIDTAGFWSRWILWNKPTLEGSIADTEKRFGIIIVPSDRPILG